MSRDVPCGYKVVGTVDVTPDPITVPADRLSPLKKGDRVTLVLPRMSPERAYADAMVLEAVRGSARREKVVVLMGVAR